MQEQLGLRLEPAKAPVDFIIIKSVQKPLTKQRALFASNLKQKELYCLTGSSEIGTFSDSPAIVYSGAPYSKSADMRFMEMIYDSILKLLKKCDSNVSLMPPTLLYNEGWMLRLVMDWFASVKPPHPLTIRSDCGWYSEALLPSAFHPETKGDRRAEAWTHADGVVGHFMIGNGAKGNLSLHDDARHFVVLEAKMFSKLSSGTKNAPYFNQAARNVACMAEAMSRAGRQAGEFAALGFYVLAPESQIMMGVFRDQLTKESIREVVKRRVSGYEGTRDDWFAGWFLPLLERIDVRAISWEELIAFLSKCEPAAKHLDEFYQRCMRHNMPAAGVKP
jgi:hypothetical protein